MNELTINLIGNTKIPMYEQIYKYIKAEIQSGKIISGEKLPSIRLLCRHLEISRSTVELAYEQLQSEGYVEVLPRKGFYAAQVEGLYHLDVPSEETGEDSKSEAEIFRYNFTPNGVDLRSFPYSVWRKLSKDVLLDDRTELFRLGDPKGEAALRQAIGIYLHQARGVNCRPEQIIVGAGSDYMLLLLNAIIGTSHPIAFENPSYRRAYRIFKQLGYETYTVDMDRKGMDVEKLKTLPASLAYVMPSHQYPLGVIMPIDRRMELLAWARERSERYIIEDDYDSEFRYKGKPIPALQGYDESEKVIYLGTFSKSIAPAIRISYMVLPNSLLQVFRQSESVLSSTVSKVDQMILKNFLKEGYYERHLNKMRALYKNRHDVLIRSLRPLMNRCRVTGEQAGVHLLLTFTDGRTEDELIAEAKKHSIKVYGLSEYYVEQEERKEATILLGYANMEENDIIEAASILNKIW